MRHTTTTNRITRRLDRPRQYHPDFDKLQMRGWKAAVKEGTIPEDAWKKERQWALRMGLTGSDSLTDKSIPTFARGELPHYAGINTFLKAPYIEDATLVGNYDAAVLGVPFDGGTTYRPGTRFGPQALRRISARAAAGSSVSSAGRPSIDSRRSSI